MLARLLPWRMLCLLLTTGLLLGACSPAPAPPAAVTTAVTTPTVATAIAVLPTQTPAPAPTQTLVPTLAPTQTPEPTSTPTPIPPTQTPEPTPIPPTETPVPTPVVDDELGARLQAVLDSLVADGFIPGATLAVGIPGYQTWTGASGWADPVNGTRMTPDTRVRIASISKILTAVVVLQLAEEGKLALDNPLSAYFPQLVPYADTITVRHLLRHQTGLYDYLEDPNYSGAAYEQPDRFWAPEELVLYAAQFGLAFAPGSQGNWDYSSTNFVILGMIIEQVTGNSLAAEVRARIFEPLGMVNSYSPPDEAIEGERARGYIQQIDRNGVNMSFAFGTAHIVSTPADLQRFAQGLFVEGRLLRPESLAHMYDFVSGKGQYRMAELEYGLGLMRNRLLVGPAPNGVARPPELTRVLGHTGGFGGFRSVLWYAPESGIIITLGENQGGTDPNILATRVMDTILTYQGR